MPPDSPADDSGGGGQGRRPPLGFGNRTGIALGFSLLGLLVVIATAQRTTISPPLLVNQFGLFGTLPLPYWAGMAFMGIGLVIALRGGSQPVAVLTGTLLVAMFAGTSVLFDPNPPIGDAYFHMRSALDIAAQGRLPVGSDAYAANWPGLFIVAWSLYSVGGLAPMQLIALFPFLSSGLTFLALIVFLRTLLPWRVAVYGGILSTLANVWAQYHLSPQGIGLFLALLVLATVLETGVPMRAVSVVLFVGLVVSHPTSTILILSILIVDSMIRLLRRVPLPWRKGLPALKSPGYAGPAVPFAIAWLGWLFFVAQGSRITAEETILSGLGRILRINEETTRVFTIRTVENLFALPPLIRLASLGLYAIVGVGALTYLTRRRGPTRIVWLLTSGIVGALIVAGADIVGFRGLLYDRSLMMLAVFLPAICLLAYCASRPQRRTRQLILVALTVASLAASSTFYYQEAFYFISDEQVAVSNFLQTVPPGSLVLDGSFPEPVWVGPEGRPAYSNSGFYAYYNRTFATLQETGYVYAVFDGTSKLWYLQYRGGNVYDFYERQAADYPLIYDNGHVTVYLVHSPT